MKKSSLLHNPKDMLSRSFKPAKLKTSLKLATSRMKLMKNKKDVQLNQMRRELAQLLESGQAQTARIRVEHVIREEKMKAAYELLDIYSELIVARLTIIESQKACPIDLKEAITSVIFASTRCGEIPELIDARKQLTTKYGKEFASAAIEMRPNCGVSRLIIEKLSAGAPDLQTKMKTLVKIAEENNIKWDSTTMGCVEPPPEDLLNGPKTFEASGVVHKAPPTPNYQAPPSHDPVDYYAQQNVRPSPINHEYNHGHGSFSRNTASSIPQDQMKPHGIRQENGQVSQVSGETSQREGSSSISGQSWDMEFKDAASAARAAAESAECATMAAKAAAEFSSRVQDARESQHTSKVHNSFGDSSADHGSRKHGNIKPTSDYISQDSVRSNVSENLPRFQKDLQDVIKQENRNRSSKRSNKDGHTAGNGYVNTASSRSEASVQDSGHGVHVRAGNHPKEDEIRTESSMQRRSGNFEIKGKDHSRDSFDAETFANHREGMISKQSSGRSASSRSKASGSDDEFSNYGIFGNGACSGPFVGKDERASSYSAADAPVTFDDSGSDGEDFGPTSNFNVNKESDLLFGSPSRSPHSNLHTFSGRSPLSSKSEYSPKKQSFAEFSEREEASPKKHSFAGFSDREEASPKKHSFAEFSERVEASPKKHSFAEFSDREEASPKKHSFAEFSERVESSPRKQSFVEFSERVEASPTNPQEDTFGPVTFDDSDGSESDTDVFLSKHDTVEDVSRQRHSLEFSDSQIRRNDNRKTEIFGSDRKTETFGSESPNIPSSSRLGKSQQEFSDSVKDEKKDLVSTQSKKDTGSSPRSHGENLDDEDSDDGKELKFNLLTGGFRHKGYFRPPYTKAQVEDTAHSSSRASDDKGRASIKQSTAASTVERFTNTKKEELVNNGRSSRVPDHYSDSDSDSPVEDVRQPINLRRKQRVVRDGNTQTQSKLRGSTTYFDSESEDDSAAQVKTGNSQQVGSGISRRTKVSPPSSSSGSRPKAGSSSRVNDFESERTQTSRTHGTETPEEYLQRKRTPSNRTHGTTETRNSDHRRKSEQATKDRSDSRTSTQEVKSKPSQVQPPVRAEPKVEKSENQKAPPSKPTIEREDSSKNRPSHVHPKLPDFDSLAARLEAIRMNRQ